MYSIYIGPSAPCNLNCARCIADEIYHNLHPPREELFDPVEEHVIEVLYDAWNEAIKTDLSAYEKVWYGPSVKYVMLISMIFDPLSHFVTNLGPLNVVT